MPNLQQKTPTTTCAVCHKFFNAGDRVITVFIVQKVGRNMETQDMGAWLGEDFELVHAACADPALDGNVLLTGVPR
jgi:hypothetical protein